MFTLYQKYFEVLARVARRRLFWPGVFALFILYACLPLLNEQNAIDYAQSSPGLASAVEALKTTVKTAGVGAKEERTFLFSVSPFAQVSIPYRAYWETDSPSPNVRGEVGLPRLSLRLDQIALVGAMIIMLALTLSTLYPKSEISAASVALEKPAPAPASQQQHTTARQVFAHEVKHAEFRAETLFKRSTYLLTGGVLMAFVGVAVFYATLPEPAREENASAYWIRAVRAGGMLLFLEAIAWFLLRQYRSLVEDFKSFHRIYMKRANYLAAITVLDKEVVRPEDLLLVGSLLTEDFSGKLVSGETTESLENMKVDGENPIFKLMHDALSKTFSRSDKEKSVSATEK